MTERGGKPEGLVMKAETERAYATAADEPFARDALFRLVGPLIRGVPGEPPGDGRWRRGGRPGGGADRGAVDRGDRRRHVLRPVGAVPRRGSGTPGVRLHRGRVPSPTASGGHPDFGAIVLLPIVWLAVYGTRMELIVLLVAVAVAQLVRLSTPGAGGASTIQILFQIATAAILVSSSSRSSTRYAIKPAASARRRSAMS